MPILDPLGRQIATILWEPSTLGKLALLRIAPTAAIAAVLVCGTMGFLLWIGFRNLREVRRREQEALRTAGQDGLTGLPNRRGLSRELVDALSASRGASPVAVIYLDLDGFKEVNDAYGHEAGDRLLVMVANAFGAICKDRGLLARVGGDEFAVVVRDTWAGEGPGALAERMVRLLDEPFDIDGRQIQIGTSVGVAIARGEQASAEEMLRRADVAMYLAKEFGRNRVAFYDPSIDAARAERLRLAEDLRSALRHDRLALVYQPIFEARTMRPAGVEALLRWLHPQLGLVPPDKFIPIAEENGLIEPIGEWVLRRACADALAWPEVKLSVNVSPVQFRNPGFDLLLADVLADTGFPPSRLEIEMTETHLVANPDRARSIISSLRQIGVTIALDDFGTGYSSIGYLRRFSFDKLKLDRSLVVGVTSDPSARRLCEATIALARALDLRVTAEGVETEEEGAILRQAGCDQFQGYAYARPMTAETIGSFLIATLSRPMVMPWAS
ncbi:MAG: EAL domain-containing protein [Rhizobiales bacterium]|nr:EAL domain-containing protein [Hyphomicrobiales bacterium]